jgi:predicted nucleotidyltransferase
LIDRFGPDVELRIFGPVARGDYQEHSDIDLLVVLPVPVNHAVEEQVFDMACDVELEYGLVIGTIVYSKDFWYSDRASAMPLFRNIQREGLFV